MYEFIFLDFLFLHQSFLAICVLLFHLIVSICWHEVVLQLFYLLHSLQ